MPQIEVLPDSSAAPAPGWAYVADTGYDPSKVAINPKDRKRVSHRPGGPPTGNELSARQRTAIARRIADLERDNDPKSNIPIPTKIVPKTPATKKIIQSNKAIKNWLDDEDAMIQLQQQAPQPRNLAAAKLPLNRRLSTLTSLPATPSEVTPAPGTSRFSTPNTTGNPDHAPSIQPDDPLFAMSNPVPQIPSPSEIEALLTLPPLRYGASFAEPPTPGGPPQRYFCDNCGYWGKIKCLKCGARVCGLECKDAHEGTRCLKWV